MSILKVARLGHPVIREKAKLLTDKEISSSEIKDLIDHMIDTMRDYDGVGIAAPQVHISKQIAVIEVKGNARYPEAPNIPLTVLINPKITTRSKKTIDGWEGCLSVPDLRGMVPRSESLKCEAVDQNGEPIVIKAEGFFARVIQHECDHLEGCVYLDRMQDLKTLSHLSEFARFWAHES